MNPEELLAQFDVMAESPNGVQRLRELILRLAVPGRLTPHQSGDLIETTGSAASWEVVQLGSVAQFVMGQAPPGSACNTTGSGAVFVKAGEFGNPFPEIREWTTRPLKFAQRGDVLICVVGATAGKLNLGIDCAIGRSVAAIRPSEVLLDLYLYRALQVQISSLRQGARGSAQGVISRDDLSRIELLLPPLPQQHRIVAKVDELMALCDRLESRQQRRTEMRVRLNRSALHHLTAASDNTELAAHWQRLRENFHLLYDTPETVAELRQAVLQLAVRGQLVPQNPSDEPATVLLERIEVEKQRLFRGGRLSERKRLRPIGDDKVPFVLPQGWSWTRLGEISSVVGGIQKSPKRTPLSMHFPYLRVANVQRGTLELSEVERFELTPHELEKWRLEPGDLLIVEGNGSENEIGRCARWGGEIPNCVHQNHLIRVRPLQIDMGEFILRL